MFKQLPCFLRVTLSMRAGLPTEGCSGGYRLAALLTRVIQNFELKRIRCERLLFACVGTLLRNKILTAARIPVSPMARRTQN